MATVVKLPVWNTVGRSFIAPFRFFWPLAPFYLVVQLGIVGVLGAYSTVSGVPGSEDAGLAVETANIPLAVIAGIIVFVASVMLIVLTHRLIAGAAEPWRLAGPFFGYLLLSIGIFCIAFMLALLGGALMVVADAASKGGVPQIAGIIPVLGAIVAVLGSVYFFIRYMLALPAAAVGRPSPIAIGQEASQGNWWRLLTGFLLITFMGMIFTMTLILIGTALGVLTWPPIDTGVQGLANGIDFSDPNAIAALAVNVGSNYFVSVASTAYLTFSLIALWRNVEPVE